MNEAQIKAVLRAFVHDLIGTTSANAAFSRILSEEYANLMDARGLKWLDLVSTEYALTHTKLKRLSQYSQLFNYELQYEPCQLDVLINSCNQIYNEQLTVEFTGAPCVVSCKELLNIYFSELMSNTVKHGMPEHMTDQPALTAWIQYHEANGCHHFMYCDNGIGIHTNDIDYVLQPLNTLGESHDDNASAGLGFSILLRIAELLLGNLSVHGFTDEQQSEFTLNGHVENSLGLKVILTIPVA